MIHHAFVISAFSESDSMLPQEITSSGRPIPIKLSVDSATIALRMFITTINIIDEKNIKVENYDLSKDLKLDINFEKVGHKRLMAKFANLEIR